MLKLLSCEIVEKGDRSALNTNTLTKLLFGVTNSVHRNDETPVAKAIRHHQVFMTRFRRGFRSFVPKPIRLIARFDHSVNDDVEKPKSGAAE